jgi:outer membrane protein OmpA-like peptidoglycan-associated protein
MTMFPAVASHSIFVRKWGWGLLLYVFVAGCQTPPPPPAKAPALSDEQVVALRELGFQEEEGGWELNFNNRILFSSGASDLSKQSRETIAYMVKVLRTIGIDRIRVEGYTDDQGSHLYNEKLSLRRAQAVAHEIERNGLLYSQITVEGFGEDNPIGDNRSEEGRAQNRRVIIIVPVDG